MRGLRGAACAAIILVGVCTTSADIQNFRLGNARFIEKTESCVMGFAESVIGKATLHYEGLGSVDYPIVNLVGVDRGSERKSPAKTGSRENNLAAILRWGVEAGIDIFSYDEGGHPVSIFDIVCWDSSNVPEKILTGLSPCIDDCDNRLNLLTSLNRTFDFCHRRPDPCPLGCQQAVLSGLSTYCGGGGLSGGSGGKAAVCFDERVGLNTGRFHLFQLTFENDKGQESEYHGHNQRGNRNALSRGGSLALSVLLFLIGFKFLDEVVKWRRYRSAAFLILSITFMSGAICALLYGFLDFSFP